MDKRGISPLIATVLLIVFALVIAGMILSWGRGQVTEITEEAGEQIDTELACSTILGKVAVTGSTENNNITVTNANSENINISGTWAESGCTTTEIGAGATSTVECSGAGAGPGDYSLFVVTSQYTCGPITGTA